MFFDKLPPPPLPNTAGWCLKPPLTISHSLLSFSILDVMPCYSASPLLRIWSVCVCVCVERQSMIHVTRSAASPCTVGLSEEESRERRHALQHSSSSSSSWSAWRSQPRRRGIRTRETNPYLFKKKKKRSKRWKEEADFKTLAKFVVSSSGPQSSLRGELPADDPGLDCQSFISVFFFFSPHFQSSPTSRS